MKMHNAMQCLMAEFSSARRFAVMCVWSERPLLKMPRTDDVEMSIRRELCYRPRRSMPDNRDLHNAGRESLRQFILILYLQSQNIVYFSVPSNITI